MFQQTLLTDAQLKIMERGSPGLLTDYLQQQAAHGVTRQLAALGLLLHARASHDAACEKTPNCLERLSGMLDAQSALLARELTALADGKHPGELTTMLSQMHGLTTSEDVALMLVTHAKTLLVLDGLQSNLGHDRISEHAEAGLLGAVQRLADHKDSAVRQMVIECQTLAGRQADFMAHGARGLELADLTASKVADHRMREFITPTPEQLHALEKGFTGLHFTVPSGFSRLTVQCEGLDVQATILTQNERGTMRITAHPLGQPDHVRLDLSTFPCGLVGDMGEGVLPQPREGGSLYFRNLPSGHSYTFLPLADIAS